MDEHPRTVADPRAWLRFGLRTFVPLGGMYGIAVVLLAGVAARSLQLGNLALVAIGMGFVLGAVLGFVCGTVDGALVRVVSQDRLRAVTSAANALVTLAVMLLVGFDEFGRGPLYVAVFVVGPPVAIAVATYRSSPEARRITG